MNAEKHEITIECVLGEKCYRKKKKHFQILKHPHLDKLLDANGHINIPTEYIGKISEDTLKEQLNYQYKLNKNCPNSSESSDENICENKSVSIDCDINIRMNKNFDIMSANSICKEESTKQRCSYGEKCYRQNLKHFESFSHPHLNNLLKIIGNSTIHIPNEYKAQISHETLKLQLQFLKNTLKGNDKEVQIVNSEPCGSSETNKTEPIDAKKRCKNKLEIENKPTNSREPLSRNDCQAQAYRYVVLDRAKYPILNKLMDAAPYSFFLTTISNSPATHEEMLSVTFAELVDPNLGELESSLQINFMVEFGWVLAQYHIMGHRNKPMTLLYGDIDMELDRFKHFLTAVKVKPPSSFGSHHTKMMIFSYTDHSVRVVVSTANLVESDWDNRTQGLWIGPRCRSLVDGSDTMAGDSPTNFKRDIIKYLSAYKLPELVPWIKKLQKVNMSSIKVFFIASIPGTHRSTGGCLKHDWGHPSLAERLNEHIVVPDNNSYPVIVQCSSIGSLGNKPEAWLLGDMLTTFTSGKRNGVYSKPPLKFIYPSFENIASSYDGLLGGGCLPYSRNTHMKQEWVTSLMCQWISDKRYRTRAPPHIKTYCRVSPELTKLSYFLLTSANLSKAAWGMLTKSGSLNILSYEAGVLFLPQFLIDKEYFPLTEELSDGNAPIFPMPYDLPPTPYAYSDTPWFIENIL